MTRRQRQRIRRTQWKRRLLREYPSLTVSAELYETTCVHLGKKPSRMRRGRHGGRLEKAWARAVKARETITMTSDQMSQVSRQSQCDKRPLRPYHWIEAPPPFPLTFDGMMQAYRSKSTPNER